MIRVHVVATAVSAALAALGCVSKAKESKVAHDVRVIHEENAPGRLFEKAKQFHSIGDLNRAEQYYSAAMQQGYPENAVLPLLLRVCIQANRFQVAIDYAEPALKKNPGDHRLRLVVASLYSAIGQPAKAREHYQTVLATAPDDATAHYALGVLLRDEFDDRVGADEHFRAYLRLEPDGPHVEEAKASLLKIVQPSTTASGVASGAGAGTSTGGTGPTPLSLQTPLPAASSSKTIPQGAPSPQKIPPPPSAPSKP